MCQWAQVRGETGGHSEPGHPGGDQCGDRHPALAQVITSQDVTSSCTASKLSKLHKMQDFESLMCGDRLESAA